MTVLLLMFIFGFAKAAIIPLHSWLPAAMVAPTPVSALLHAVAVVKVGVFSILRLITGVFGTELLLSLNLGTLICNLAAVSVLTASLIAMTQDDLKRRLAFSTISQLSYIVLGLGLLSLRGITGSALHIAMHAFGKITLFFCAGAIFAATGRKKISEMVGIGKKMPLTMIAFLIGAMSVIGLPPCGGFISKWFLVLGTLEANQMAMLLVLLASSLLNAVYFLPIVYRAFFCAPHESMFESGVNEAPIWCLIPLSITAIGSIILFFYPQPFLKLAQMAVLKIIGGS
jgi:multicomponent Na+:H+ antiporter subunit D